MEPGRQRFVPDRIVEAVCAVEGVGTSELYGRGRSETLVRARERLVGALRVINGNSFPEIAAIMCRKYHSSAFTMYERWKACPERWRREYINRVCRDLCAIRGPELQMRLVTTYPPLALHYIADLMYTGKVDMFAAANAIRNIADACDRDQDLQRLKNVTKEQTNERPKQHQMDDCGPVPRDDVHDGVRQRDREQAASADRAASI